jgi:hypothetical protein
MVIDEVVCQQCGYEHAATVWDDDGWGALCGRCGWFSDAPLSESNEGGIETRTVQGNGAYCLAYGDGSDFCFGRTDGDVGGYGSIAELGAEAVIRRIRDDPNVNLGLTYVTQAKGAQITFLLGDESMVHHTGELECCE